MAQEGHHFGKLLNATFASVGQRAIRQVARETFEHMDPSYGFQINVPAFRFLWLWYFGEPLGSLELSQLAFLNPLVY